jgi:putative tributyrin esterase
MPEGDSSYYVNSAQQPRDRFEDYIVIDLLRNVESKFPVSSDPAKRAIVGVSMGGYGAVTLASKHPGLFAFAGGLSAALDVPSRPFSIKRLEQWRRHRSIFGEWGSQAQRSNDPLLLVRRATPDATPYLFLTCGEPEGLLSVNRQFATLLAEGHFRYEFHSVPGGHDWKQWSLWLPSLSESLSQHFPADPVSNHQ